MGTWLRTITFGDVLMMAMFLVTAILSYNNLNWRVKIIELWKEAHHHTTEQRDLNINLLRENAAKLTALMEGQERRLILLEDRPFFPGQHKVGM